MLTAQVTLPGLTSSVPTARHFVESLLTAWGLSELAWPAALVVSELAANCALHARSEFGVRVQQESDTQVRLEVSDLSPGVPKQRSYGSEATTGRGLRLVDQLTASWGVEASADGKTVWVVLGGEAARADGQPDGPALPGLFEDDDPR
ncbi:MAG: ATP-binding protein [Mycobacteriales bacterium]